MKPQDIAEAYVRKHCPELMELSFGCVVSVNGEIYTLDSDWGIDTREENDKSGYYRVIRNGMNDWTRIQEEYFEIIGHPIQLQHWLRAIETQELRWVLSGFGIKVPNISPEGIEYVMIAIDFTTGQPATETDYQAFCNIVGVEDSLAALS